MNNHLRELYQDVIIDHGRNPRHFHAMDDPTISIDGINPLCGDKIKLYLKLENDLIKEISFDGSGCAISMASSSLMSEAIRGKTVIEAKQLFQQFHTMIIEKKPEIADCLGKLGILYGVNQYPARIKCATLAWHALDAALQGNLDTISTE